MKEITFEEVFSFHNLMEAADKCRSGVTWKASVQLFEMNRLRWISRLHKQLMNGTYKSMGFNEFWLCERGKMRFIQSVHISERVVQKALCEYYLKPLIVPTLIYDNSASLKNRGPDFALGRLRCHLQRHYREHGRNGGILVMDYKNYFGSISHEKLLKMLRAIIKDDRIYNLVEDFINALSGDYGIGLGSEVYQICAVFYPNIVDHYIKEKLGIEGYGRYMDDSYVIHHDYQYLQECKTKIEDICRELDLTLNKKTKIYHLDEVFKFLKKRTMLTKSGYVVMRLDRGNPKRYRNRMRKNRELFDAGKIDIEGIEQSHNSWEGFAKKVNSRKTILSMRKFKEDLFKEVYENERGLCKGNETSAGSSQ